MRVAALPDPFRGPLVSKSKPNVYEKYPLFGKRNPRLPFRKTARAVEPEGLTCEAFYDTSLAHLA